MAFFKSLLIASVAAVAFAAPQGGASDNNKKVEIDSQSNEAKCGNGQKLACCNTGDDLIGLNCLSIPIRSSSLQLTAFWSYANHIYSRCPHPAGLRFQRRCMLLHWRCLRKHFIYPLHDRCLTNNSQGNLINVEANCLAIPL